MTKLLYKPLYILYNKTSLQQETYIQKKLLTTRDIHATRNIYTTRTSIQSIQQTSIQKCVPPATVQLMGGNCVHCLTLGERWTVWKFMWNL